MLNTRSYMLPRSCEATEGTNINQAQITVQFSILWSLELQQLAKS